MFDFDLLSNELIVKIHGYADLRTKMTLSLMDKRLHEIGLSFTRSLRVFPIADFTYNGYPSDMPEDILIKTIFRYSRLQKIIFGPSKDLRGFGEFKHNEVPYLKSLITHLQSNLEEHPLNSVKKIEFREVDIGFNHIQAKELNKLFLSALSHKNLENIRITTYSNGSVLTGDEIQSVLTNSSNLKTFKFNGFEKIFQSSQIGSLSFAAQSELCKLRLFNWNGSSSTIESLKTCKKLQKLAMSYKGSSSDTVKTVLLKEHSWNLKHLDLSGITLENDEELDALTKKLPNLECFQINKLQNISDAGMELIGKNCPNLKTLQFFYDDLTNSGLEGLTKHLPNLEIISFYSYAAKVTEVGITALGEHCKKLRLIQVVGFGIVEKSGIDALATHCPNLRAVNFSCGRLISLKGMDDLIEKMKNLRFIAFDFIRDIEREQIGEFYKKHPLIKTQIPRASNIKLLHRLTV